MSNIKKNKKYNIKYIMLNIKYRNIEYWNVEYWNIEYWNIVI